MSDQLDGICSGVTAAVAAVGSLPLVLGAGSAVGRLAPHAADGVARAPPCSPCSVG